MFELTKEERDEVVANCDHLGNIKYSSSMPRVFTEYGILQAANVLNSERAILMGNTNSRKGIDNRVNSRFRHFP